MKIKTRVGIIGLALLASSYAYASAPADIGIAAPSSAITPINAEDPYPLDTEMTLRHWVLCISPDSAEQLRKARADGPQEGAVAYASLQAKKACGEFPELRAVLQQPIYEPSPDDRYQGRIFSAAIKFSGQWARGYVLGQ